MNDNKLKTFPIAFRVDESTYKRICFMAQNEERNVSNMTTVLIKRGLDKPLFETIVENIYTKLSDLERAIKDRKNSA